MKRIIVGMILVMFFLKIPCSICLAVQETKISDTISINARNAVLFDRKCKRVLFEKKAYEEVSNASTTKILTAIVVAENCDKNEMVEIGQNAVNVTGSKVKFRKGDKVSVNDLMNGMLLCSGNDAAIALAEYVSGSIEAFCEKMNKKAKEIGANHTHFVTPHGLDEAEHYSTAYDLALISDYALNIPYLAKIFSKKSETIMINGIARNIHTTNEMLYVYPNADGVKTGFTNQAGRCLVTSATNKDGWQLISVVLGCDTKNFRTQDSKKILDYGFQNYEFVNIGEILPKKIVFEVEKGQEPLYKVDVKYEKFYPMTEEERKKLHFEQTKVSKLEAPVKQGTEIVKYRIYIEKEKIVELAVSLKEDIRRKDAKVYFFELLESFAKSMNL